MQLMDSKIFDLEAKYGLPTDIKFCSRCVISNQRPNSAVEYANKLDSKKDTIHFDADCVCDACRAAEEKEKIDWTAREAELHELCDRYRRDDGGYDCLVPGSGGKDSFFQSHILKHKFGMHPLTVTWAPHIYTDWGWRNFMRWINAGFDNNLVTPNGRVHRLLTRLAVDRLFHPFQPFIIGQKTLGPKMSVLYDIPLVFYGENEAEYGNPKANSNVAQRDWQYFSSEDKSKIYIGGVSLQELKEDYGMIKNDLVQYMPVDQNAMEKVGTEVHYLGYYLKWHPQSAYYYAQEHGGFEAAPERTVGTYSKYNSIDDKVDDFHYYTTYMKFGIGRATYDSAQEIRSGEITRDEGIALIRRFDGEYPARFSEEIFKYLSITKEEFPDAHDKFDQPVMDTDYFMDLADTARSPHLWEFKNDTWSLRHTVWDAVVSQQR